MNLDFKEHIPSSFHNNSKVWIFQNSKAFLPETILEIENKLQNFISNWKSHGDEIIGFAKIFFNQFIVILADETKANVSGCSTDIMFHQIKEIEKSFNIELFNRQSLAFVVKDTIQILPLSQLNYAIDNNFINIDSLYFNNTILNKNELLNNWVIPVKNSWLASKIQIISN